MKTIKLIDFYVNIVLIALSFIAITTGQLTLIESYFVVGSWQVISMIIHTLNGWFLKKGGPRRVFHKAVIIIGICVLLSQVCYPFLLIFFFLWLGSPLLAMIYTSICYDEIIELKSRNLLRLK